MMASFGRKKLFEILNKAKAELEAERSETSSIVSDNASELNVNPSFPRGAGRARLLRPELLNQSTSGIGRGSASTSSVSTSPRTSTPDCDNASSASDLSAASNALEFKEKKRGTSGDPIALAVNYIPILCKPDASVFEYDVSFDPDIHSNLIRRGLLSSVLKPIVPVYTFDGVSLYLPRQFQEKITKYTANNWHDNNSPVQLTVTFRRQKSMRECIHFYNILFKQVMLKLEYVQFGRKMFDPTEPMNIPHRQLTIWPGYVTACGEYDEGLMLLLDTSHRVLFDTKVLDLLRRIEMSCRQHAQQNFKDLAENSLLGAIVLTPYNNRTYTISDIDFEKTPKTTFQTKNGEISYVDYYKKNYGVDIHDLNQPLLMSYKDRKMITKNGQVQEDRLTICLIPELSQLTGLTDEMRNDKKVMRDIASYTRLTPNQRVAAARKYIERVNETPDAKQIMANWGLQLNNDILRLDGRQLPLEKIKFGENKIISDISGDFSNQIGNNVLFEVVDLKHWILMYTRQDTRTKDEFLKLIDRCAGGMGLSWDKPFECSLPDDRNDTYTSALRQHLRPNTQMAVFICPTSRDDRYATIKKICCSENPVASQVINSRTLSNPQKNRSIVQKILMQMNCKLGGSLWTIRIPFKNVMICGTDTYHSPMKKENSVAAFVASLNSTYTKWYSKATIQSNHEELLHGLSVSMANALSAYKKHNEVLPDRIIMYRDGVGDGQFALCQSFEFPQLKAACQLFDTTYNPDITFIVVQKRVNTRIFSVDESKNIFENAPPGTVVDHSITRRGLFDFFLVSQKMRHGTVTPSHYVVIENETNLEANILQQLSYKLTYQYFNWPGSIRVPAPCQYAHKMAYLVGESIKRVTSEQLGDKLFYL